MYRINEIRVIFEEFLNTGLPITPSDSVEVCKQNFKITGNWLLIGRGLLKYKQVTADFLKKLMTFLDYILSSKEDTEYSTRLVSNLANNRSELDWIKALLEQGKAGSKNKIKKLKDSALEALILIHRINDNLHIIRFLKVYKQEYVTGYSPYDSTTSLYDIKQKIDTVFVNAIKKEELQNVHVDKMFKSNDEDSGYRLPLDLALLNLAFEEDNSFEGIDKKAIAALCLNFNQKKRLLEEASK
jgi:hypothetical protein